MNHAEAVCKALEYNDVEPAAEFTAMAGRDYGMVRVWRISDSGACAIKYGDNGTTNYELSAYVDVDDEREIGEWLLSDDLDGVDKHIAFANIFGLAKIEEPDDDDGVAACAVLVEHDYYGGVTKTDAARDDRGDVMEFASAAEAQAWIDEEESDSYVTQHNETGRPSYKVVAL